MSEPAPAPASRGALDAVAAMRTEIGKAVVGQDAVVDQVLCAFLAGGNVLVEGVPGLGKTLLVLALARTFGGHFARIQFTPDLMPSDVTGHAMLDPNGQVRIRQGPAFTNLLLADEINRAPAKTQAALLEVMQERQITIEGRSYPVPQPFMALATQNPIAHEGTYPLPEAQLDRFLLKVLIDYPSEAEEVAVVGRITRGVAVGEGLDVSAVRQVLTPEQALGVQRACAAVHVDERVIAYAVRIARATRGWPGIQNGAGPRGAIALVRVARARALLGGRDHVIPDDVKDMALPVLRHRVLLSPELEIEGQGSDQVLAAVLGKVEAPRQ